MKEDWELWDLLARSPRPTAPPFFSAKTARRVLAGGQSPIRTILLRWLAPAAVAALVVFALLPRPSASESTYAYANLTTLDIVEMVSPDDYALLTSVGGTEDDDVLSADL